MGSNSAKSLWEAGTFLCDAWLQFAPPSERERYYNLSQPLHELESRKDEFAKGGLSVFKAIGSAFKAHSEKTNFICELYSELLDNLYNKNLIAFGYRERPSTSSGPIHISEEIFFDPDIDWKGNRVTAHGKSYGRVRIFDPYADQPSVGKLPHRGRIGSANSIRSIIGELSKKRGFCDLSRKEQFNLIRKHAGYEVTSRGGFSNENLGKYIIQFCPKRGIDN